MRTPLVNLLAACVLAPALSSAQDAAVAGEKEAARDMGAVLAWRLGPETVEERCRGLDPEGNESRRSALQGWLEKNARLIKAVDERITEVAPMVVPPSKKADAVGAVRGQVKAILIEAIFSGTPEEAVAFCKGEANPESPRWTSNGMPHVQNSLAALYDWKVQQGGK
jgi:hypothetical protein